MTGLDMAAAVPRGGKEFAANNVTARDPAARVKSGASTFKRQLNKLSENQSSVNKPRDSKQLLKQINAGPKPALLAADGKETVQQKDSKTDEGSIESGKSQDEGLNLKDSALQVSIDDQLPVAETEVDNEAQGLVLAIADIQPNQAELPVPAGGINTDISEEKILENPENGMIEQDTARTQPLLPQADEQPWSEAVAGGEAGKKEFGLLRQVQKKLIPEQQNQNNMPVDKTSGNETLEQTIKPVSNEVLAKTELQNQLTLEKAAVVPMPVPADDRQLLMEDLDILQGLAADEEAQLSSQEIASSLWGKANQIAGETAESVIANDELMEAGKTKLDPAALSLFLAKPGNKTGDETGEKKKVQENMIQENMIIQPKPIKDGVEKNPAPELKGEKATSAVKQLPETEMENSTAASKKDSPNTDVKKLMEFESKRFNSASAEQNQHQKPDEQLTAKVQDSDKNLFFLKTQHPLENSNRSSSVSPILENTPIDSEKMLEQLVKKAELMIKQNSSEMKIQLHPEFLGKMTIKIMVVEGLVTAKFITDSHQVKHMLDSNLNTLRQSLEAQGIRVEKTEVNVQLNNGGMFDGSEGSRQDLWQQQKFASHYGLGESLPDEYILGLDTGELDPDLLSGEEGYGVTEDGSMNFLI